MIPQHKAEDLVDSFIQRTRNKLELSMGYERAKVCALIAVDEILKTDLYASEQWYWKNVLKEIEKL